MRRWTTAAAVLLVAVAATVGLGYVWHDHLRGVWGPGDRGAERAGRGDGPREGFRPPRGDGDRGERRDGDRGGAWFTAEGMGGFAEAAVPMLLFGGIVVGADRGLRARRRRHRHRTG